LLGLLSLIDAMLEMPTADVLERVPLDHETKAVLMGQPSLLGPVYQLVPAHESGAWESASQLSESLNLDPERVAGFYWRAQPWTHQLSSGA
jgi:EAL and modified HD-GYP domain-containing signal transduction protein